MAIIGAIYPNDAWVDCEANAVVDEFRRFLPEGTDLISVGTPNPAVDNTVEESIRLAENGDIEEAARRLLRYEPAVFAYYCTTMSFVRGPEETSTSRAGSPTRPESQRPRPAPP